MQSNIKKIFTKTLCLTIATVMLLAIPVGAATTTFGSSLSSDNKKITTTIKVGSGSYFYVTVTGYEKEDDKSTKDAYNKYSKTNSATGGETLKIYHIPSNVYDYSFVTKYDGYRLRATVYTNTSTELGTVFFYD